jgi:O-antigen ligase
MYGLATARSAHSIYFSILGDHGFIGLVLFLGLIASSLYSLFQLRHTVGRKPGGEWVIAPALMVEASLLVYAVNGAFLTSAYFDLFYHLTSIVVLLRYLGQRSVEAWDPARRRTEALLPAVAT